MIKDSPLVYWSSMRYREGERRKPLLERQEVGVVRRRVGEDVDAHAPRVHVRHDLGGGGGGMCREEPQTPQM
jgi:hypothetical protein